MKHNRSAIILLAMLSLTACSSPPITPTQATASRIPAHIVLERGQGRWLITDYAVEQ